MSIFLHLDLDILLESGSSFGLRILHDLVGWSP